MKLSKKDIKKIIAVTKDGEIAPVTYKDGKLYIPTSDGVKVKKIKRR